MATIFASGGGGLPDVVPLASAQTGTGPSTNVCDRGGDVNAPALLDIVSTIGATPTVTVDVQGSADGALWWNVSYSTTPIAALAITALTITTATTNRLWLPPQVPWRYLRLNLSANTNVTLTANLWVF